MPENPEVTQPVIAAANGGFDRLVAATARLEAALDETVARYAAMRREHLGLKADYAALKAKTESVGAELEAAIASLKALMAVKADHAATKGQEAGHG